MTITHLVLSGGAYLGFAELGALDTLCIDMAQIQTYDATSIGCIFSVLFALGCSVSDVKEYFVERPWEQVVQDIYPSFSMKIMTDVIEHAGIFDEAFLCAVLVPFLSIHFPQYKTDYTQLTLKEFYEYTHKDIYFYTVRLPMGSITIELMSVSHYTHPELPLLTALQMTTAVPILFKPVQYKGDYYVDGGLLSNYPLEQCLERGMAEDTVMSIYLKSIPSPNQTYGKYMLFDFQYSLLYRMIYHLRTMYETKTIGNELIILCEHMSLHEGYQQLRSREAREAMVDVGKRHALLFQEYQKRSRSHTKS